MEELILFEVIVKVPGLNWNSYVAQVYTCIYSVTCENYFFYSMVNLDHFRVWRAEIWSDF